MTKVPGASAPGVRRVQELRRSNAARPVPSGKAYKRRAKHRKQERV